jgi:hypothetical protein
MTIHSISPGHNELHCLLLIGGIPLLILATQGHGVWEGGGISSDKKGLTLDYLDSR